MKKKNAGIIASLIAMQSKVFCMAIPTAPALRSLSPLEIVLYVVQGIIAPIIFLIGIIMYLKKSKSSKIRKVAMTIIFILLLVEIYFGIEILLDGISERLNLEYYKYYMY